MVVEKDTIYYHNGEELFTGPFHFRRIYGLGEILTHKCKTYIVTMETFNFATGRIEVHLLTPEEVKEQEQKRCGS